MRRAHARFRRSELRKVVAEEALSGLEEKRRKGGGLDKVKALPPLPLTTARHQERGGGPARSSAVKGMVNWTRKSSGKPLTARWKSRPVLCFRNLRVGLP